MELGNESAIDEYKEELPTALDAQSIEHDAGVLVQLNERAISSVLGRIRRKGADISLRNPWHLFDGNLFAGNLRPARRGKNLGVSRIRLGMHAEGAMPLFRNACHRRRKQAKNDCPENLHAD